MNVAPEGTQSLPMNALLILKLILVPSLIAGVTLSGRRWGPAVAGWLSAFPVIAGPILLFMAVEQGAAFTAAAAVGTLSAVLANLAFGVAYARVAARHAWPWSLAAGLMAYFMAVALLHHDAPSLPLTALLVALALLLAPRLYPTVEERAPSSSGPANDIWLRMLAGALLTALVTHFAARMGPGLSGMFAMFPVMGSVLTSFTHRHDGPGAAVKLLKGMVLGYYAFSIFCITLALTLSPYGLMPSFIMAFGAALSVQVLSRIALQRRQAGAFVLTAGTPPLAAQAPSRK